MSRLINQAAKGRRFISVTKSEVNKNPAIELKGWKSFTLSSRQRGKELILTLAPDNGSPKNFIFNAGMSGHWKFYPSSTKEIHKHAHLIFTTTLGQRLCFNDTRRFGTWKEVPTPDSWSTARSPCPVKEFPAFCKHISDLIETKPIFKSKPICELMLNQDYFNGIGNYLRAEILHRAKVHPQVKAYDALSKSIQIYKKRLEEGAPCLSDHALSISSSLRDYESGKNIKNDKTKVEASDEQAGIIDAPETMYTELQRAKTEIIQLPKEVAAYEAKEEKVEAEAEAIYNEKVLKSEDFVVAPKIVVPLFTYMDIEDGDILSWCHVIPVEVINANLGNFPGSGWSFKNWLQVYQKSDSFTDKAGRTMFFNSDSFRGQSVPKLTSPLKKAGEKKKKRKSKTEKEPKLSLVDDFQVKKRSKPSKRSKASKVKASSTPKPNKGKKRKAKDLETDSKPRTRSSKRLKTKQKPVF